MIISVVMTTYNGEKYILEQLESIRCQTRIPDEVIIKDDCSKDKTVSIAIKTTSDEATLFFRVNLYKKL